MNHIHQQLTLETLPDDVLIEILRLVARYPVSETRPLPFPIVASRVNRRFRTVALTAPELWSTIRLSRHARSWHWAPIFLSRSGSYPLDISISLEDYEAESRFGADAPIPLPRALAIRNYADSWSSPPVAAALESAHMSMVDNAWDEPDSLPPLAHADLGAFKAIHTLDIDFGTSHDPPDILRTILGSSASLRTLIMRTFPAAMHLVSAPIEATTIISLAVSFGSDNFSNSGNFSDLTRAFSFPNLEYLEIMGGSLTVSDEYHTPTNLFPNLHTLRLEGIDFTPIGLASIQSFSHGITTLELICTANNHHLLAPRANQRWPALDSLTVCTSDTINLWWLPQFLAMRAVTNAVSTLMLSPWLPRFTLPYDMQEPEIRWLQDGFSRGLMDGISGGCDFYLDEHNIRIKDFRYVEVPERPSCIHCALLWYEAVELEFEDDTRQTDEAIAEAFKATGEVARAKGMGRELKKTKKHQNRRAGRMKNPARRKGQRYDFEENFSLTSG
ncbi:hypothetical protein MSAN_01889600 [Mycena sanguinolenta]|uniref:F-box domain-containing protein n=1 Tax=Mycena sanguinolenta TaxID=230812 RepID=A0A8H6XNQ8_9AGAR|nr:hypothetical protein MSAN_01889600 [Mycena sanguinolenta]